MPKVEPALWQASAALRKVSRVQFSAFGSLPAGYIACTSMPACCFIRSMREHGPLIWLPTVAGTPSQRPPLSRPRYSTVPLTLPFWAMSCFMISSTGSSESACSRGHQLWNAKMSWPAFACASAAIVEKVLVSLRRDEIHLHVDFFLVGPGADDLFRRLVGARHPMVPEADRQAAGRIRVAHERRGDKRRRGGRGLQKAPTRYLEFRHGFSSRWLSYPSLPPACRDEPRF